MTTAKLKNYYLAFWLKPETAETWTAKVIWGLGVLLIHVVILAAVFSIPMVLVKAFPEMRDYVVAGPAILVWMGLAVLGFFWLLSRLRKWQEEREFEHTADLPDGQVVTLNLKTANGVDYADRELGEFLKGCLSGAIRDWKGHHSI